MRKSRFSEQQIIGEAAITDPSAPAPPLRHQQNPRLMAASTRRTQIIAVASTRPATKSPLRACANTSATSLARSFP